MDIKRIITTATTLVLLASCASSGKVTTTPEQTYNKALGGEEMSPGNASTALLGAGSGLPYSPVVVPSEILRVWIYDHVTPAGDLVVGHWIFIRLRNEHWYIEDQFGSGITGKPDPQVTEPILKRQ